MNDDAKFFFFLSGFFGFVFFYAFSIFLNRDPVMSLIYGSSGSLFFALMGRTLLISALRKVQVAKSNEFDHPRVDEEKKSPVVEPKDLVVESSLQANKEAVSSNSSDIRSLTARK